MKAGYLLPVFDGLLGSHSIKKYFVEILKKKMEGDFKLFLGLRSVVYKCYLDFIQKTP